MKQNIILLALLGILLTACQPKAKFHVQGRITEAADTMLYLEHITLADGVVAIDSARLDTTGAYSFSGEPIGCPELYRLRIGGQYINLAIDSTETVTVNASLPTMARHYTVEGSGVCDTIRMLANRLADLQLALREIADDRQYTLQERSDLMDTLVSQYKQGIKHEFLNDHFASTSSYYAVFQTMGGTLLFNPILDRDDLRWMRAIANAWHERWPEAQRTKNLVNIVAEARRHHAKPQEIVLDLEDGKVRELGIIDMTFPDVDGHPRTLSELRGKVVLLDFTAFSLPANQERTLLLRELYHQYHEQGLEIYQVSLDADRHFWQQRCEQLPWVCVYCQEGTASDIVQLYQVDHVPYLFLIDRNCDLQAREENIADLEQAIESLL